MRPSCCRGITIKAKWSGDSMLRPCRMSCRTVPPKPRQQDGRIGSGCRTGRTHRASAANGLCSWRVADR